jgi:Raf kinase inhibitor-like YbhB/YbcL family protein
MSLTLVSADFDANGSIPAVHTCEGTDTAPALSWSGAPQTTWVHWVLYNIPVSAASLPSSVRGTDLPPGTRTGLNDWKKSGYDGPCPPTGRHRYVHKLYALDVMLPDLGHPTKAALEQAMQGHILMQGELIGTYQKRGH